MNDEHINFDDWLSEQMQDEDFRAEYQRLDRELNALRVDQKEGSMNDCAEYIDRVIAEFQEKKSDLTAEELEQRTAKEMAQEFIREFKERVKAQRANPEPDVPTVPDEASFEDLCEIEPCLRELESRIRAIDSFPSADAAAKAWQGRYKPAMMALVGYYARKPEMRSHAGYDTAYGYLYGLIEAKVWMRG